MIIIKTNDRELVAVEVPRDSYDHFIKADCVGAVAPYGEQFFDWYSDKFDATNCKIIGLLSELTEQQAAEYSSEIESLTCECETFKELLLVKLQSNGLNTSAPILLIEKVK